MKEGNFYRNLKRDDVAKVYAEDNADPARYGYRVKSKHWRDAATQGGLSVNLVSCVNSPCCSILVHPFPEKYAHVVDIDLAALSVCVARSVLAQYAPVSDNACHFELMLEEGGVSDLMALMDFFDQFPPGKRPGAGARDMKRRQEEEDKALAAHEAYSRVFLIHRNVLG